MSLSRSTAQYAMTNLGGWLYFVYFSKACGRELY